MFSDLSLCALTSENEIEFGTMGEKPTALFLQIPDEKETRHTLASMVILQAYKELVYKANTYPNCHSRDPSTSSWTSSETSRRSTSSSRW
jgi:hypothetical protein